jgi:hypothetical protein
LSGRVRRVREGRGGSTEGASEWGEVGERGARLKRGEDVRRWLENVRSWACPQRGTWAGGWGRTDRWGLRDRERERERERERARGREEQHRQYWPTGQREGEGERARGLAPIGGTPLSDTEGVRARAQGGAGLNEPTWAELGFSIFREFLIAFLFIFSRVFNSNSNQVSNSN